MENSTRTTLGVMNDDILHMIIACTLEDTLKAWPSNDHFVCAVRLSSVFRRLRAIMTSRPIFWNRLFIDLKVRGEAFEAILTRSQQAQLYVFVLDPVCLHLIRSTLVDANRQFEWRKSALAFLKHRSRICELEMHGQSGEQGELKLADALGPLDHLQQIAARSHSLRRLALHDLGSTTLLCLAGINVTELSLTGHLSVNRRVLERALAEMTCLRRLTLDTVYVTIPNEVDEQLAAYNLGADLEFLRLGWSARNHWLSDLTDFCTFVTTCLPGALACAKEVYFDFRHSQAWTSVAMSLIDRMELDTDGRQSTLEIDGETSTYTLYTSHGRVCVMSAPSLREATLGRFHRAVTAPAKTVTLTCNGGSLELLDDTVLAPWERSRAISNATSLELVLEVAEIIDYTMLEAAFSRNIPMPALLEVHLWLFEEGGDLSAESAEKLAVAPICVELVRCFQFPAEAQQFFVGPSATSEAIAAVSEGEFHFSSTKQKLNVDQDGIGTAI